MLQIFVRGDVQIPGHAAKLFGCDYSKQTALVRSGLHNRCHP